MGMFDSLYIELDGREHAIQTKRFDCVLGEYRLGDWVGGSLPGIRVYFDRLDVDANGRLVYGADAERERTLTLFVVLAQGVFVEYRLCDGALTPEKIELQLRELQERWSDSARLQGFLVEAMRTKQRRIALLERRLARVRSVVASAHRLQAGERLDGIFDTLHEESRKLAASEDPLDVIAWVLGDDDSECGLWEGDSNPDRLAEYRL